MIASIERTTGKKARIIRKPAQPGDVERTFADVKKAAKLLGYEPKINFAEGMRKFIAWCKRSGDF